MASSSSVVASSSQFRRWKYDVFLSFRGEDTRQGFTSHFYEGLRNKGIFTFQDDKRLEHGSSISKELVKAIQESQIAIIVFSTNYAASGWCLDELTKIMECKIQYGQKVIPVFYDVDPSMVRHQKGSFAEAFEKHEARYKDAVEGMQKVHKWRTALTDAANLSGHDIRRRIESDFILQFVNQISSQLYNNTSLAYLDSVVGIDARLEKLKSLLEMQIDDVRIVGIWGMGGVGKTTIASALFDTISNQFEGSCFLPDVKENKSGIRSLQNTLLSDLLKEKADYVNNKEAGKGLIARRLCLKKVLIILDDIDHRDHLDYLAGDHAWFGNGSRIIATTRDKHLMGKDDAVYKMIPLVNHEAVQLFNQYAFKKELPGKCFHELIWEVVSHADGLPLALKVWGSLLYKRGLKEWRNVVDQIKKKSTSEIVEKLKISYDGLEDEEKEIFLDIACCFRGLSKEKVMTVLESCDFGAKHGLDILIEKSLVFISGSEFEQEIEMHDLIQDMGIYIVNLQKNPRERSRLWLAKDVNEVMINNTGTNAVEVIWIPRHQKLCFRNEGMKNMKGLRILNMDWSNGSEGCIDYMPSNLRWFSWRKYPGESLPENFEPKRIVHLDLSHSRLRHLWMGRKDLRCLRTLNLSESRSLMQTPDFTGMPNLENLDMSYCESLEEVHNSLRNCNKLIRLYLNRCGSLKRFPCVSVDSLHDLRILGCSSLEKFPEIHGRMNQTHLSKLDVSHLKRLIALPISICRLKSLVRLTVSGCSQLESLPEEIGDLENLMKLDARWTLISRPPSSIVRLNKLESLSFTGSRRADAGHFVFPQVNDGLRSLQILNLIYCNLIDGGLPDDIGCLSALKELRLRGNNFERLPQSITQLRSLRLLDLRDCERLTLGADFQVAVKSIQSLSSKYMRLQIVGFPTLNDDEDFAVSLFECMLSALDSSCKRVIHIEEYDGMIIPASWLPHQVLMDGSSLFVDLPANWYVSLGFVICCSGKFKEISVELLPSINTSLWNTRPNSEKLSKMLASLCYVENIFHFVFIPVGSIWDTSKTNGATPNDYAHLNLSATAFDKKYTIIKEVGIQVLYKDGTLSPMRGSGDKSSEFWSGMASGSSSKKRKSPSLDNTRENELCALPPLHFLPLSVEYEVSDD